MDSTAAETFSTSFSYLVLTAGSGLFRMYFVPSLDLCSWSYFIRKLLNPHSPLSDLTLPDDLQARFISIEYCRDTDRICLGDTIGRIFIYQLPCSDRDYANALIDAPTFSMLDNTLPQSQWSVPGNFTKVPSTPPPAGFGSNA
ncbi:unnamed protein product, partial [Protopolystoma xenopodis]